MCNPKHKILRLLKSNLIVSRTELTSRVKSTKTKTIINWLLDNNYVITSKFNPENLSLTPEGEKYHRRISKQLYAQIAILASVLPILIAIVPLFSRKEVPASEQISINQNIIDSTFYIRNSQNFSEIVETIESKSSYKFDHTSNKIFEITYSGDCIELRSNYYFYPGGCLVIKFGGDVVREFESLRIEKTSRDGSLSYVLSDELERRVMNILSHNKEMVSDEIISILTDQ